MLYYVIISSFDIAILVIATHDTEGSSMNDEYNIQKYLPLTEATYYTLLALIEPRHGYIVMQKVKEISQGTVDIGPGTLYGIFSTLQKEGLILKVKEENRRKTYALTPKGKAVLREQIARLEIMTQGGLESIDDLQE
jgi:DNA-binding PadR family transcriptional regulator